jgi:hypothetical protein
MSNYKIFHRSDRLGSNLTNYIAQIIQNDFKKRYIIKTKSKYEHSIFFKILNDLVNEINKNTTKKNNKYFKKKSWHLLNFQTTLLVKSDLLSYFKNNFYYFINNRLTYYANKKNFKPLENWSKIICIHLRLDDVSHISDYNGKPISDFYSECLNNNCKYSKSKLKQYVLKKKIKKIQDYQSSISEKKIKKVLQNCKIKFPDHKVVVIASPIGGEINIKADKIIRSSNPDLDLLYLIYSNVLICSKSTYSLAAAYFHQGEHLYIPLWGHFACTGIDCNLSKKKYNLFY